MSSERIPSWARSLAGLLACLLAFDPARAVAQEQAKPRLNIVIVEGEGAINNIRLRTAREPIVQVEDENHRPVAGAVVVFLTPDRGASAVFPDGSHMMTVTTDQQGRAVARGLRPNRVEGQYQIRVTASYQGSTANAVVAQSNIPGAAAAAGGISGKLIAILAVAGGAAVAGGVYAATRGASEKSVPPIVITPGTPSVGGPR